MGQLSLPNWTPKRRILAWGPSKSRVSALAFGSLGKEPAFFTSSLYALMRTSEPHFALMSRVLVSIPITKGTGASNRSCLSTGTTGSSNDCHENGNSSGCRERTMADR